MRSQVGVEIHAHFGPEPNADRKQECASVGGIDRCRQHLPAWADAIFEEVATLGEASVRRIYGDFSTSELKGWQEKLHNHAVQPHQQFAYTKGKNSSDIALVIDAMDLLHTGRFGGFVLVSSDSDFTRLASRIREQGVDVFGIGRENTPESFRRACKRFIFVENLIGSQESTNSQVQPEVPKLPPTKAVPLIRAAMRGEEDGDCVPLSLIGNRIRAANPDFDPRTYGWPKLSDLIEKTGHFELDRDATPMCARLREAG